MKRAIQLLVVIGLLVVGTQVGWRYALAPLMGLAVWVWLRAMLRSFLRDGQTGVAAKDEPTPVPIDERTMYWCEECGTEVVLTVRGSGLAPRHCGERMHERSEILRS